jgi:hypothetical protein
MWKERLGSGVINGLLGLSIGLTLLYSMGHTDNLTDALSIGPFIVWAALFTIAGVCWQPLLVAIKPISLFIERVLARRPFRVLLLLGILSLTFSVVSIESFARFDDAHRKELSPLARGSLTKPVQDAQETGAQADQKPGFPLSTLLQLIGLLLLYLLTLALPYAVVVVTIIGCFQRTDESALMDSLRRIIGAYALVILSFTGIYYTLCVRGDRDDAVKKYIYYSLHPTNAAAPPTIKSARFIEGISTRMYSGIDWPEETYSSVRNYEQVPVSVLVERARQPSKNTIRFQPSSRRGVLIDCLYFSVVTIATLGYGDITPKDREAKMAAGLEVLSGIALFVIALALPSWRSRSRNDGDQKRSAGGSDI